MEELKHLARTYYSNTVRIQFFGVAGFCYLISSIAFLVASGYLQFSLEYTNASMIPILAADLLGAKARKCYNSNLIRHLSNHTLPNNDDVDFHKAIYLQSLVSHIANSLLQAMRNFK